MQRRVQWSTRKRQEPEWQSIASCGTRSGKCVQQRWQTRTNPFSFRAGGSVSPVAQRGGTATVDTPRFIACLRCPDYRRSSSEQASPRRVCSFWGRRYLDNDRGGAGHLSVGADEGMLILPSFAMGLARIAAERSSGAPSGRGEPEGRATPGRGGVRGLARTYRPSERLDWDLRRDPSHAAPFSAARAHRVVATHWADRIVRLHRR